MAAVTPVSGNKCRGTYEDGSLRVQLYCYKGNDSEGDPIYTCATWRKFKVSCPKVNALCSSRSEAWVAAITVCNQRLF
jgi:hypothetical protein